jgi:hypothetical protein
LGVKAKVEAVPKVPPPLFGAFRTCIHNRLTPSGQAFSRPAALKNLAIHQVLLRFFALQGGKIPCPACIIRL